MSILFEFIAYFLLEVLVYGTGKIVAQVFLPHVGIEPLERQRSAPAWKWRGFTYLSGNRRFFYTESIELLGLAVWLVFGLMVLAGILLSRASAT